MFNANSVRFCALMKGASHSTVTLSFTSTFTTQSFAKCNPHIGRTGSPLFPALSFRVRKNDAPAVVVMQKNNAQELEQWTFKKPMSNVQGIKQADFNFVAPPKDWQVKQAGAATTTSVPPTPKVARPAGP